LEEGNINQISVAVEHKGLMRDHQVSINEPGGWNVLQVGEPLLQADDEIFMRLVRRVTKPVKIVKGVQHGGICHQHAELVEENPHIPFGRVIVMEQVIGVDIRQGGMQHGNLFEHHGGVTLRFQQRDAACVRQRFMPDGLVSLFILIFGVVHAHRHLVHGVVGTAKGILHHEESVILQESLELVHLGIVKILAHGFKPREFVKDEVVNIRIRGRRFSNCRCLDLAIGLPLDARLLDLDGDQPQDRQHHQRSEKDDCALPKSCGLFFCQSHGKPERITCH